MAIGFPASFETEVDVTGSRHAIREAVEKTLGHLGFDYSVDEEGNLFTVRRGISWNSWGEDFTVSLVEGSVLLIRSTCRPPQIVDWGVNKRNVESFRGVFLKNLSRASSTVGPPPVYLDENLRTPLERAIEDSYRGLHEKDGADNAQ